MGDRPAADLRRVQVRRHERVPGPVHQWTRRTPSSGSTPTRRTPTRAPSRPRTGRRTGPRSGARRRVSATIGKAAQDGRLPALLDVRQVLQDRWAAPARRCPPAPARTRRPLPDVLVLRVGRRDRHGGRLGLAHRLQPHARRLPEPAGRLRPRQMLPAEAQVDDRAGGLGHQPGPADRVLPLAAVHRGRHRGRRHQQLGGPVRQPPAGTPTFYGMFYDEKPVYHDPPSATSGSASRRGRWSASPSTTSRPATPPPRPSSTSGSTGRSRRRRSTPDGTYRIPSTLRGPARPTPGAASHRPGAQRGTSCHRRRLHRRRRAWPPRTPRR